jgi:hypothetical protein
LCVNFLLLSFPLFASRQRWKFPRKRDSAICLMSFSHDIAKRVF